MKQINQEELEELVQSLIDGKTTRKKLAKTLETDIRTVNNKITELASSNPALYEKYVKKFPYKPKTREDIDFEALIIYTMKNSKSLGEISEEYGVSIRTIARRIKEMEKSNPELIGIYRIYADNLKKGNGCPLKIQLRIDELEEKPIILSKTNVEVKENELRKVLERFEKLVSQGMPKVEAARTLGYDDYPTIWKKQQELKRIETEKKVIKQEDNRTKKFRESIKVDSSKTTNSKGETVAKKDESTQNKEEGR